MTVQRVRKGMILREDFAAIIQALEDSRFTDRNGQGPLWCEFEAVNLITQQKVLIGAANPPMMGAPSLELVGWATNLA